MNYEPDTDSIDSRLTQAANLVTALSERLEQVQLQAHEPIAVTGMALRLPGGADTPHEFWEILSHGVDATDEFPAFRADADPFRDSDPEAPGKAYTTRGGYLRGDISGFDPEVFRITPREAAGMDPQQRLALELGWESLEDAGVAPDSLEGTATGVWFGASTTDYVRLRQSEGDPDDVDAYQLMGEPSFIAGRLSFTLGLRGPSSVIDTACSSSLVALHEACASLRRRETDLALAGGVNLLLMPYGFVLMSKFRALAADGRCKTFDDSADGYARGEGGVVFTLKRLSDAQAAGDRVLALVRGTAVNHDGRSSGISVPNPTAQQEVVQAALTDSGLTPADISYVEAHGTGTGLGDPIELWALNAVLGRDRRRPDEAPDGERAVPPLLVGSVKSNIGHLEPAAGAAGIAKVLLAMEHGALPPSIHINEPNSKVPWHRTAIGLVDQLMEWPADRRRIAGISSFGVTGTNAHVILEAPSQDDATAHPRPSSPESLTLSARSPEGLQESARAWAGALEHGNLRDLAWTSRTGRARHQHGLVVTSSECDDAAAQLRAWADSEPTSAREVTRAGFGDQGVGLLFTGQGAQYSGMGIDLLDVPWMRPAWQELDDALASKLGFPVRQLLTGEKVDLSDTRWTQPALFAYEYAVAQSLRRLGVDVKVAVGHSIGEISAAAVAGVFTLESAAELVVARGALMSRLARTSGMLAVGASEAETFHLLERWRGRLDVAGINSPTDTVVAGFSDALDEFREECRRIDLRCVPLHASHGFHSPAMDPILAELDDLTRGIAQGEPDLTLYSNVTGQEWNEQQDTRYWSRHARGAVRYYDCIRAAADKVSTFIEVGPHPTLTGLGRASVERDVLWLSVGSRGKPAIDGLQETLGALHLRGQNIDWEPTRSPGARPVGAPHYPWQRRSFWFPRSSRENTPISVARPDPVLGQRTDSPVPTWVRQDHPPTNRGRLASAVDSFVRATLVSGCDGPDEFRVRCRLAPQPTGTTVRTTLLKAGDTVDLRIERSTDAPPRSDSRWLSDIAFVTTLAEDPPTRVEGRQSSLSRVTNADSAAAVAEEVEALLAQEFGNDGRIEIDDLYVRSGHPETWTMATGTDSLDLCLLDRCGNVLACASGVRHFDSRAQGGAAGSDQVLTLAWEPTELRTEPHRSRLVLAGHPLSAERLTALQQVAEVIDLTGSDGIALETVRESLSSLSDPLVVVITPPAERASTAATAALDLDIVELIRSGCGRVRVMTQGCHEVADGLAGSWVSASHWGLGRTAALEQGDFWSGLVDVSPTAPAASVASALVYDGAEDELLVDASGQWHVHRLRRTPELVPSRPAHLPDSGTVIVTGAYGGIGQRLCRWLVGAGVSELLLMSRAGADRLERQRFVTALRDNGCKIVDVAVDVADASAVSEALERHRAEGHVISGVVHAAGVSGPQDIADVTVEEYQRVWNPKVLGALSLHESTIADPIELFLCFSSIAATWGSQHLASYAAANSVLDSLCEHRAAQGQPGVAVAWGPWDLPSDLYDDDIMDFLVSVGLYPLSPDTSIGLIDRLATTSQSGWVVSDCDWQRYVEVMEARRPRPVFEPIAQVQQSTATTSEGPLAAAMDPTTPFSERWSVIERFIRTTVADVLGVREAELHETDIFSSGMDSLMVMDVAARFSRSVGTKVQVRDLFERSALAEWVQLLAGQLSLSDETENGVHAMVGEDGLEEPAVLVQEISLPEDLLEPIESRPVETIKSVLLTGATGFVGTHIVNALLSRPDLSVTCLVRGDDPDHARKRLLAALQERELTPPNDEKLHVLPADLSAPDLGLSTETWGRVEGSVDAIIHNGAAVNFVHTFDQVRSTNLDSLATLLRHARAAGNVPVHYVSTYGVWGLPNEGVDRVLEDDDLMSAGRLVTGYTQSKWAADYLARSVREAGQNVAIHRPGRVVCDSTGRTVMEGHFTTRVIQGCIESGYAPDLDFEIEITTVDYVAAAIASLALEPAAIGMDYHLVNPVRMPFSQLVSCLNDLGYPIRTVPREEWWSRLTADDSGTQALDAVLPTVERLIVGGERAVDYDTTHSRVMLDPANIICPPLDESLVASLVTGLTRANLIPAKRTTHM